jgi:acyl transferase domain-containing protein
MERALDASKRGLGEVFSSARGRAFTLHFMLWSFWERAGVRPQIVLGEGVGEISAALACGGITFEDACELVRAPSDVTSGSVRTKLLSLRTGEMIRAGQPIDARYWTAPLEAVPIPESIRTLASVTNVFLEIGTHPTLRAACIANNRSSLHVASCVSGRSAWDQLMDAVAKLYVRGLDLSFDGIHEMRTGRAVLPTYAFAWRRHWLDFEDDVSALTLLSEPPEQDDQATAPQPEDRDLAARLEQSGAEDLGEHLSEWLRKRVGRLLGHSSFDGSTPLRDLGVDSLQAVGLLAVLDRQFGRRFPAVLLLEQPTLDALASHLCELLQG